MQTILTLTSFYVFLSLEGVFFQEVDMSLANVKKTYFDIVCLTMTLTGSLKHNSELLQDK